MAAGYSRTVYFILVQEVLFCSHIYALKNECVDAVKTGKMCHFSAVGRELSELFFSHCCSSVKLIVHVYKQLFDNNSRINILKFILLLFFSLNG